MNEPPNELFEWTESPQTPLKPMDNTSLTSPLRTLKTIIWSIDWEISDQILMMLNEELNQLKQFYQEDETILKFLQLMEATGRYIKKRKGKSHPESVSLLREFFVELERIVFMLGMPEGERKAILHKQIEKFNSLKKRLAASRTTEEPRQKSAPEKLPPDVKTAPIKASPEVKTAPTKPPPEVKTGPVKPLPDMKTTPKKAPPEVKTAPIMPPSEEKTAPADTEAQVSPEFNPQIFRQVMLEEMRLVIRYEFKKIKAELKELIENQRPGNQG
jgi:septum formation inhibitor MinC